MDTKPKWAGILQLESASNVTQVHTIFQNKAQVYQYISKKTALLDIGLAQDLLSRPSHVPHMGHHAHN